MKKLIVITISVLTVLMTSCSKRESQSNQDNNPNPSIKADFQDKYDFVVATLSSSGRQPSLSTSEIEFLTSKVKELRSIIPLSGLVKTFKLDNLVSTDNWTITGQPAIEIKQFSSWIICHDKRELSSMRLIVSNNSWQSWGTTIDPQISSAYVSSGSTFDYDNRSPQYSFSGSEIIALPSKIVIDGANLGNANCFAPRNILIYTGYSDATLSAIAQWQAMLDGVLHDIQQIQVNENPKNYPISYVLDLAIKKIQNGFNALP